MARRVGIDCRLAGTKHTGIGRYIAALVPKLIEQAPSDYHWVLFVFDQKQGQQLLKKVSFKKLNSVELIIAPGLNAGRVFLSET